MSPLRLLTALAIVSSVLFGMHYYLWARWVRDTAMAPPWRVLATLALALLAGIIVGGFSLMRSAPRSLSSPLLWVAYVWMGLGFFSIALFGAADLVQWVAGRVLQTGVDLERRQALARLAGGAVMMSAVGLSAVGARGATAGAVVVQKIRVALSRLPAALGNYRIVQISDVHVGPTIGREFLADIVARVNALQPDLVAITGDLVDGTVEQLGALLAPLKDLRAKDGVFFTTGNHEYYWPQFESWFSFLEGLGIRVLRNERVRVGGEHGFDLAGIDDLTARSYGPGHGADLDRALAGRDSSRALVLLAHHPRQVRDAQRFDVDLQLSGHTHGGQMFPFSLLVRLVEPYVAGLYTLGKTTLYVSRGTGYWGPPMRLGSPAEITEVTLTPAQA